MKQLLLALLFSNIALSQTLIQGVISDSDGVLPFAIRKRISSDDLSNTLYRELASWAKVIYFEMPEHCFGLIRFWK